MNKVTDTDFKELVLPSLRAKMEDWVYYITFMRMEDIAARVSFAEEIHKSQALKDLIQRKVTNRAGQIGSYLLSQGQRFFNALVVGAYEGEPRWYELEIGENNDYGLKSLPDYLDGAIGILHLSGGENLFAIDGQHRVAGIREALKGSGDKLTDEEVCVIFLSHRNTTEGMVRTRRLFTTLNRYAKPVSSMEKIALDEDDVVAIINRRLLEDYPLFAGNRIAVTKEKSIPPSNSDCLTTVVALYETLDIILSSGKTSKSWKSYKTLRPDDSEIEDLYRKAQRFWDSLVIAFPPLKEVQDEPLGAAGKYRNREGGHLLFRPVGLLSYSRAVRAALDAGMEMTETIERTAKIPMRLADFPWAGLLWDTLEKLMITSKNNQKVTSNLIYFMIDGDLSRLKIDSSTLKKRYAAALNKTESEVTLPPKVHS